MIPEELAHINLQDLEVSEVELNNSLLLETARIGKFTCSEFHKLMTYENKIDDLPKGAMTVIREKVSEVLTESTSFNESWTSDAMQWGKDHELEAIKRFTEETGIAVKSTGDNQQFTEFEEEGSILNGNVGGTPDGDIDQQTGLEIKCPNSSTHLDYILKNMELEELEELPTEPELKIIEKKYYWQVQGYMMLTGKKFWFFVSYDPRFKDHDKKILIKQVKRNDRDIQKLKVRLEMCVREKNRILDELL